MFTYVYKYIIINHKLHVIIHILNSPRVHLALSIWFMYINKYWTSVAFSSIAYKIAYSSIHCSNRVDSRPVNMTLNRGDNSAEMELANFLVRKGENMSHYRLVSWRMTSNPDEWTSVIQWQQTWFAVYASDNLVHGFRDSSPWTSITWGKVEKLLEENLPDDLCPIWYCREPHWTSSWVYNTIAQESIVSGSCTDPAYQYGPG